MRDEAMAGILLSSHFAPIDEGRQGSEHVIVLGMFTKQTTHPSLFWGTESTELSGDVTKMGFQRACQTVHFWVVIITITIYKFKE